MVIVVPVVPLVSLVSATVSVVPAVPLVSLVSVAVSVRWLGSSSANSAYGFLGVYSCICEVFW